MRETNQMSRRLLLSGVGAGAVALVAAPHATATTAAPPGPWAGSASANGWQIGGPGAEHRIEGTDLTVVLATGAPAAVLLHAVRRVGYELGELRPGDVVGLVTDRRVASAERSNLLSGTAIHLRPGSFPRGTDGNLFPPEVVVLEDIVAEADGVLGWGGHLDVPDQGLLYVTAPPASATIGRLAGDLDRVNRMDAAGGAGDVDAFDPARRTRALAFGSQRRR
ncbi:MAG: hypothetical protein ACRCYX_06460 [Dermatophilaceae bacterium]